jgi:hypothetical protein
VAASQGGWGAVLWFLCLWILVAVIAAILLGRVLAPAREEAMRSWRQGGAKQRW